MATGKSHAVTIDSLTGKSILITGATGFVGKVVLEKLLRTVPGIERIYLLIRGNTRYPSAADRFQHEVATSSIFNTLKGDNPDRFEQLCAEKLRFVEGELTADGFGLDAEAFEQLANDLDVVINSAASVNFREPLDDALRINALSLYTIIRLVQARKIPVVHVSTCYVNGFNQGLIEEAVGAPARVLLPRLGALPLSPYEVEPLIADLQQTIGSLADRVADAKLRSAELVELGLQEAHRYGWNDTYTFTKWMGEQLLLKHLPDQSLTIVRPSIVESTLNEPAPGWIEGVKVADAIIMAYAREKVTFFPGDRKGVVDIIPADLVANSIILATAEAVGSIAIGEQKHRVYQCSSSDCNPVSIQRVIDCVTHEGQHNHERHPNLFYRQPQRPFVMVPSWVFSLGVQLACVGIQFKNRLQRRFGGNPSERLLGQLDAANKLALIFEFYTRPRYRFSNQRLCDLHARAGSEEQKAFPVDARVVDWSHYLCNIHIAGLNQYALKPRRARGAGVTPQTATA